MIDWHIGCSGFYYKHWKGSFYPEDLPQKKWFEYYCESFKTVELNVTFYHFPQLSYLQSWYDRCPKNFQFAVKAPRIITHYKKFTDTADIISDFYHTVSEGLQEKLGCVLFQMPPKFTYSEERLEKLVNSLDPVFPNVAEFRHESWWQKTVYQELARHNISFCGMSHPTLPDEVISNTPMLYYRLHGKGQLYASNYEPKELQQITDEIKKHSNAKDAFIFFNNDIYTYAIYNAQEMQKMAGKV